MPWCRLHYHLVWATSQRQPWIGLREEEIIHRVLRRKAEELRLVMHGMGGIEDHRHVVVSIPAGLSVSECVKHLKGASARAVNQERANGERFQWQAEYGAVTVDEETVPSVVDYVLHQREHHARHTAIARYETIAINRS